MKHLHRRTFLVMAAALGVAGCHVLRGGTRSHKRLPNRRCRGVVRIAHLSRRQGPEAEMAAYAIMGAQLGAEEADVTAGMFGTRVELIIEDAVTPENVVSLIDKLSSLEHLSAIIVALDERTTAMVSDVTQQQRLVCLNAAARGGDLRGEQCHRLTFHVEPDVALYTHAMGQWLVHNNRKRWHLSLLRTSRAGESTTGQTVSAKPGWYLLSDTHSLLRGESDYTERAGASGAGRCRGRRRSAQRGRACGCSWSSTRHQASPPYWLGYRSICSLSGRQVRHPYKACGSPPGIMGWSVSARAS